MQSARIADILEIFHGVGLMHLLIVESATAGGGAVVRGLISRSCIKRRLDPSADETPWSLRRDASETS
jgi:hypothetical protein